MLEMVTDLEAGGKVDQSYLGIDFGTSNSCISYIDHRTIQVFDVRSESKKYTDLQDMRDEIPYILAEVLPKN